MKYIKYKNIVHLTFFGYNDELRNNNASLSLTHPLSNGLYDTKRLKFRFNPILDVELTNYARIALEFVTLPTNLNLTGNNNNAQNAPLTIRTNSLSSYKSYDTDNRGSLLLFSGLVNQAAFNPSIFQNTHPDMVYNFAVDKSFLQRGELEITITYPFTAQNAGVSQVLPNGFDFFSMTLVIYDIDENLLLTDNVNDFNKEHIKHQQGFLNNNRNTFNNDPYNNKLGY